MSSSTSAAAVNLHPTVDYASMWAVLEEGLDNMTATRPVSYSRYMTLHTLATNYCIFSRVHNVTGNPVGASCRTGMGPDLYNKLARYFTVRLENLKDRSDSLQDEAFLRYYAAEWDRYTTGAKYINGLFSYFNHHWVKRQRDKGRKGVYPVYTLALVKWKFSFFTYAPSRNKHTKLTDTIIRLIERERNGEMIDQCLMKKVVDSFVLLGLDETDIDKASLDVYMRYLERPFLEATEEYYEQESNAFLAKNSLSDYMKKVEKRLEEEEDRVDRYLNTATRRELVSTCENVLIGQHSNLMLKSFQSLLDFNQDEDMYRMYALLSCIPEGLEHLRKNFLRTRTV